MFAGYQAARGRGPYRGAGAPPRRYVKRAGVGTFRGRTRYPTYRSTRAGYGSVARARGAAVTGEMKYFDCELNAGAIPAVTTTWVATTMQDPGTTINLGDAPIATPLCLFAPKVSAALNGRIGRQVKMLKCKVNGFVNCAAQSAQNALDAPIKVRILLVQDMQTNAAQMTGAQLMRDAGAAFTTINSFQNPDNFGRFRVLKDKTVTMQNPNMQSLSATNATFEQNGLIRNFKMSYTFKNPVQVHFNATNGGTVADIVDHSLHIVVGSTFAGATSLGPTLNYYSRVSYKE